MADYREIAKIFEDGIEGVEYFETRATVKLKHELFTILENERRQLLFLIGRPGCGKSIFIHRLPSILPQEFDVIQFHTPFFEPAEFIKSLILQVEPHIENFSFEQMIDKAIELYKDRNVIITIDEAQLLSKEMIELLRILADSKAFWFLLVMHEHESQKILQEPQFASRPHRVLQLGALERDECIEYVSKELLKAGAYQFEKVLSAKLGRTLFKLSNGNFRDLKKILNRMFLLMDCSMKSGVKKYQRPSKCLVTMAAIDGGILVV